MYFELIFTSRHINIEELMLLGIEVDMNEITYNCLIYIGDIHAHSGYLSTIQLPGGGRHVRQHAGVTDTDARN